MSPTVLRSSLLVYPSQLKSWKNWLVKQKSKEVILYVGQAHKLLKSRRNWRQHWRWKWKAPEFVFLRFRLNWNLSLNSLVKPRSAMQFLFNVS